MRIAFITSFYDCPENNRLKEEAAKLGHQFHLLNTKDLTLVFQNSGLSSPEIEAIKPDAVILRSIMNGVKPALALISHLRSAGIKVYDNELSQIGYAIHKVTDYAKLAQHGLPLPTTYHSARFENFPKYAQILGYPVVIKPIDTGTGIGVTKADSEDELLAHIASLMEKKSSPKRYLIQEFVPYLHDLRLLVIGDHIFCMERIPQGDEFRANFSLGGAVKLFDLTPELTDLTKRAMTAMGMTCGGVDILITPDGKKYLLEANHSPGFEGMEKATGENIAKIYLEHALANLK